MIIDLEGQKQCCNKVIFQALIQNPCESTNIKSRYLYLASDPSDRDYISVKLFFFFIITNDLNIYL